MIYRIVVAGLLVATITAAQGIASTYYEHHHTQRGCLWPVR